ncbi:hypothetical protein IMZ48_15225 [Candidatus Bathyarchaeota archaeon]|nr:hypothetical protein [Candidatus Bathyarchaeota archaeon]
MDQNYLTDPLLLTADKQTELGSVCTAEGAGPGSGTLNIGFRISMQSDAKSVPDGIVTVTALGITNRLVECEAAEVPPETRCKRKRRYF